VLLCPGHATSFRTVTGHLSPPRVSARTGSCLDIVCSRRSMPRVSGFAARILQLALVYGGRKAWSPIQKLVAVVGDSGRVLTFTVSSVP